MDPFDPNFNLDDIKYMDDDWNLLIFEYVNTQNISQLEYILRLQLRIEGPDEVQNSLEWSNDLNIKPFHLAVLHRNVNMVQVLIRYGCDVNCVDDTAETRMGLDYAAQNGDLPMIYTLVRLGAEMDIQNCGYMVPLLYAISEGKDDAIIALKALGANTDLDVSDDILLMIQTPLKEEEILYHRYRTYFESSLLNRLLLDALI